MPRSLSQLPHAAQSVSFSIKLGSNSQPVVYEKSRKGSP
jgi:hypothetical protein